MSQSDDNSQARQGLLARLTAIIGGLTAVVLALIALKSAIVGLLLPATTGSAQAQSATTTPVVTNSTAPPPMTTSAPPSAAVPPPSDPYPQFYAKPNGHLTKHGKDDWFESDDINGVKF